LAFSGENNVNGTLKFAKLVQFLKENNKAGYLKRISGGWITKIYVIPPVELGSQIVKSCSSTSVTDQHLVVVLKIKEK
jgi:hypothetical protein